MEEPYLLKYSESEAETFTQGTTKISLRPVKVSASEPSPISLYSESSRMTTFSLLGFPGVGGSSRASRHPLSSRIDPHSTHSGE